MSARPRTILTTAALLAAAGALVAGCSTTGPAAPPVTTPAAATTTATAAAPTTATTDAATTASAATSASAPGTSSAPAAGAPRASTGTPAARPFVSDPWNRGYEFGFVWGARRSGDTVTLTFDPAGMLVGQRAKAYYDAHPDEERFDFKILNDRRFTQTLRVPASATLYGSQVLGPRNGARNERITLARLLARAGGNDQDGLAVWVKRTGHGPVVYLAEQYLP